MYYMEELTSTHRRTWSWAVSRPIFAEVVSVKVVVIMVVFVVIVVVMMGMRMSQVHRKIPTCNPALRIGRKSPRRRRGRSGVTCASLSAVEESSRARSTMEALYIGQKSWNWREREEDSSYLHLSLEAVLISFLPSSQLRPGQRGREDTVDSQR